MITQSSAYLFGYIFKISVSLIILLQWTISLLTWLCVIVSCGAFVLNILKHMLVSVGLRKIPGLQRIKLLIVLFYGTIVININVDVLR